MGFRNPIRSLPASKVTAGDFTDDYAITGTFTVGDQGGAHLVLDGAHPLRFYAADGVTVLIDADDAGDVTVIGTFRTGAPGTPRVEVHPSASGNPPSTSYYTEDPDEITPPRLSVVGGDLIIAGMNAGASPAQHRMTAATATDPPEHRLSGGPIRISDGGVTLVSGTVVGGTPDPTKALVISNDLGWHAPALANSWGNFGGAYQTARYTKLATGVVVLQGLIAGGTKTAGTVLLTLPAGYRPAAQHLFSQASSDGQTHIDVAANGQVLINAGATMTTNNYLSLDGIRFTAEQ